jgi:hypothetical protein
MGRLFHGRGERHGTELDRGDCTLVTVEPGPRLGLVHELTQLAEQLTGRRAAALQGLDPLEPFQQRAPRPCLDRSGPRVTGLCRFSLL